MARPAQTKTAQQMRVERRDKAITSARKKFIASTKPAAEQIKALKVEIATLKASMVEAESARDELLGEAWVTFAKNSGE